MNFITLTRKNLVIQGLIFLLVGILFMTFPEGILIGISIYLGLLMMVPGVVMIITALMKKESGIGSSLLVEGVLLTLFGLLFILEPQLVGKLLAVFIGIWMLGAGIQQMVASSANKAVGWNYWWIQLLAGILLILFGLVVLFNAFTASVALMIWFGALMIVYGVYYLILAFVQY